MNLSPMAQATLLLTSYFSRARKDDVRPLTNAEWGRFALWLKDRSTTPADLLVADPSLLLVGWHDSRISIERITQLLARGHSLALAMEKWQRAGLWVVTRGDAEYPKRLKQRLKNDSPPVLFGCGNKALLNAGGLAVIGSRNASEPDLSFTRQVGEKAAIAGVAVVSGGARGVDETAMQGAIHSDGSVIGVMADSLLKAATSAKWRSGLMDGNAVLVSPFYPEAGFNAGNAMARNKYIYCLADSALVIHSGTKGGTLNGAREDLKTGWVPLWVKPTDDSAAANAALVAQGGRWCEQDIDALNIATLLSPEHCLYRTPDNQQVALFAEAENTSPTKPASAPATEKAANPVAPTTAIPTSEQQTAESATASDETTPERIPVDFYQLFLKELQRLAVDPVLPVALIADTGLHKSQLNDWLARATSEGVVKKLNRPVRYQVEKHD